MGLLAIILGSVAVLFVGGVALFLWLLGGMGPEKERGGA